MNKWHILPLSLASAALVLSSCLSDDDSSSEGSGGSTTTTQQNAVIDEVNQTIAMIGDDGYCYGGNWFEEVDTATYHYQLANGTLTTWVVGDCQSMVSTGSSSTVQGTWTVTGFGDPLGEVSSWCEPIDSSALGSVVVISASSVSITTNYCIAEDFTSSADFNAVTVVTNGCNALSLTDVHGTAATMNFSGNATSGIAITFKSGSTTCTLPAFASETEATCASSPEINEDSLYDAFESCLEQSGFDLYGTSEDPDDDTNTNTNTGSLGSCAMYSAGTLVYCINDYPESICEQAEGTVTTACPAGAATTCSSYGVTSYYYVDGVTCP